MKLTTEQINYIENYIKSFNIKYYEVYMEILDHIILSVEEILEENAAITFEDAVLKAKKNLDKMILKNFQMKSWNYLEVENEICI